MLKSYDPKQTWTFESPLAPGTVFTYKAITGPVVAKDFDDIMRIALNRCIVKVSNIEITLTDEKGEPVRKQFTEADPFVPAIYPEVRMADILHYQIASALFAAIWSPSSLTKEESGE